MNKILLIKNIGQIQIFLEGRNSNLGLFLSEDGIILEIKNYFHIKEPVEDSITHCFQDQNNFLSCGKGVIYTYFVCSGERIELNIVVIR